MSKSVDICAGAVLYMLLCMNIPLFLGGGHILKTCHNLAWKDIFEHKWQKCNVVAVSWWQMGYP